MESRHLFVVHDTGASVVSWQRLAAAGSRTTRYGAVTVLHARDGDRIGVHGSALRRHLAGTVGLGLVTFLVTLGGPNIVSRICAVAIIVVVIRGIQLFRLTARTSVALATRPQLDSYRLLTSPLERDDLIEAVGLAGRIVGNSGRLQSLIDPNEAAVSVASAVWEVAGVLQRRQQLRAVLTGLARHDSPDLPTDSPAVRAGRAERARAEEAWQALLQETSAHLAALRTAADTGDSLLREWDFGDEARRARVSLDQLGLTGAPPGPRHAEELADRTKAVVAAYRQLAVQHGDGLYE
jgi:hypothetical protein